MWYTLVLIFIVLLLMISALSVFVVYNFPWMTKYWRLSFERFVVRREGGVALVSDVHIGAVGTDVRWIRIIGKVLRRLSIDTVVVAGDLVDRRLYTSVECLERLVASIVGILDLRDTTILYIPSNTAHDIAIDNREDMVRLRIYSRNIEFIYTPSAVRIEFEGCREAVYATHGDYISRNGVLSYILDKFSRSILKRLFTGVLMHKVFTIESASWVALGHSHVSYLDRKYRVIGLGSWTKRYYAPRESSIAIASCRNGAFNILFIELKNLRSSRTKVYSLVR